MRNTHDLYAVLQVHDSAEPEVIEAAYKRLVRKYHPDVNGSPDATAIMQRLNAAYAVLSDPRKRSAYDQQRRAARRSEPPRPARTEQQRHSGQEKTEHRGRKSPQQDPNPKTTGTWFVVISVAFLALLAVGTVRDRLEPSPAAPALLSPIPGGTTADGREGLADVEVRPCEVAVDLVRERRGKQRRQRMAEPYPSVTAAKYRELELGMSYRTAVEIIGFAGVELDCDEIGERTRVRYEWYNPDSAEIMYALFDNDRMVQKTQIGLR